MNCREAVARLQTFLDRELSETEIEEVRMHLGACPPCLNFFKFEERLKMLVRQHACPEQAPVSLRDKISQRFRQN